ncbi:diacylglycerol kinase (ATP) [Streptomyces sp. V4I8]|uniref:diacylglycerol/lipid kinase family protein n=1 Tax=Streptomyces sp. V4I8 TaxID=3156469 RepID=UPI003512F006
MAESIHDPSRRVLVVANPASGSHSPRLVQDVHEMCVSRTQYAKVHFTTSSGDATTFVRHALEGPHRVDLVVVIGGDGTVCEVVQALEGPVPRASLAVVPGGTGNSGYKMLWGERPWTVSLKAVLADAGADGSARLRRLDLARLAETGKCVYLGAGSGMIAETLITVRRTPGHGRERYARAIAEVAAAYRAYPGRVTVDGHTLYEGPTLLVNVGGGRYRGGRFDVLPYTALDDGLLDVCVVGSGIAATEVPRLMLTADHIGHPATLYARGRTITIERIDGGRLPLEHDGEYQEDIGASATFEVLPGRIAVWGPTADSGNLSPSPQLARCLRQRQK